MKRAKNRSLAKKQKKCPFSKTHRSDIFLVFSCWVVKRWFFDRSHPRLGELFEDKQGGGVKVGQLPKIGILPMDPPKIGPGTANFFPPKKLPKSLILAYFDVAFRGGGELFFNY